MRGPVLALDPSIRHLGFALLSAEGEIHRVGLCKQREPKGEPYQARAIAMALQVGAIIEAACDSDNGAGIALVMETPANWFTARGALSKDAESVQRLYYTAGAIAAVAAHHRSVSGVWCVTPSEWKGQAPKEVMVQRACRFARSKGLEISPGTTHDACEALLLGKLALERVIEGDGPMMLNEPFRLVYQKMLWRFSFDHIDCLA